MQQFVLKPKWKPMETVPKDRPICIRARSVDFRTGKYLYNNYEVYWGRHPRPHDEFYWMILGGDGSFMPDNEEFHKEPNTGLYRGFEKRGWCEMHEIRYSVIVRGTDFEYHLGDGMY